MRGRGVSLLSEESEEGLHPAKSAAGFESEAAETLIPNCPLVQQVADEKTCMQFSIRRPKLPSSETHPEESMYRRLDVAAWLRHLNALGQVEEEYKLRKVRPGVPAGPDSGPGVGAVPTGRLRGVRPLVPELAV